jgi:hypothetical protein
MPMPRATTPSRPSAPGRRARTVPPATLEGAAEVQVVSVHGDHRGAVGEADGAEGGRPGGVGAAVGRGRVGRPGAGGCAGAVCAARATAAGRSSPAPGAAWSPAVERLGGQRREAGELPWPARRGAHRGPPPRGAPTLPREPA